jgi:U2 small nuclear ribonucleoprotein A'
MRLTAELITNSLSYNNPLNERELDLRGTSTPDDALKRTDTAT